MEKKNPNIYQRALDIVNNRINPDIPQGGGGGSSDAIQYIPQELTEAQQMQARKNQGLYYSEEKIVTWDGDTTGLDSILGMWYRVPAFESVTLEGVTRIERSDSEAIEDIEIEDFSETFGLDPGVFMAESEYQSIMILTQDADMDLSGRGTTEHYTKGCYAMCAEGVYTTKIIFGNISKIPSKFIDISIPKAVGQEGDGSGSVIFNDYSENEANGEKSFAAGKSTHATGDYSHAEGEFSEALGESAHAEGYKCEAKKRQSHAEGERTVADERAAHAEGCATVASGVFSHAEGDESKASGYASHAEGKSEASAENAHAEGGETSAQGRNAHAEGRKTVASGDESHAAGRSTQATGIASHAEGDESKASGYASHAEGKSEASAKYSHAEGENTKASCYAAHAEGCGTITTNGYQHVCGMYNHSNAPGVELYFVVGNGTNENSRHNAFMVNAVGGIVVPAIDDPNVYMEIRVKADGTIEAKKYYEGQWNS